MTIKDTPPEMTAVASTNVASAGWRDRSMYVRFKSGGLYRYDGVPLEMFDEFLRAPSKGAFVRERLVRNPAHTSWRVEEP